MTDTSTLGALTDIYGSPVETGLSGLQTPEPGNQPTPTTINSALLTPWVRVSPKTQNHANHTPQTADELRLFDESQADIAAAAATTARALEFPPLPARSPETVDDAPTPRPLGSPHSTVAGLWQSRANANTARNGPPPLTDADVAMAAPAGLMEPQQTHPIMQPSVVVNGRRTLANGLVITEAPEGGRWPARYSFEHSLKGMHPGQRTAWLAKPQPTIIATAWRQKFTNNATLATTLLALIPRIINAPEARISTPFRPDNDVLPHIPILHCTV